MQDDGGLAEEPRPCDVFDSIAGTSTGGLIAVMLGRLHMSIDECIRQYEIIGEKIFGRRPDIFRKLLKGMVNSPFYNIDNLQGEVKNLLKKREIQLDEPFLEVGTPRCKV